MTIKELIHQPEHKIKCATITITYEEARDCANAFFEVLEYHRDKLSPGTLSSYQETMKKFNILFDLIKHGQITDFTIEKYFTPEMNCPVDCKGAQQDGK